MPVLVIVKCSFFNQQCIVAVPSFMTKAMDRDTSESSQHVSDEKLVTFYAQCARNTEYNDSVLYCTSYSVTLAHIVC